MKNQKTLPALFLSHGSPMVAIQDDAYTRAVHEVVSRLGSRPKAVVVVSAHGLSPEGKVELTASQRPGLIYDFGGFPKALYELKYPCPGSTELAAQLAERLAGQGFEATLNGASGLDHGVWIPLRILFPEADIPVIQVSMPYPSQPEHVLKLGKALAPLREEGVLLIGSGGMVHNLGKLVWHQKEGPAVPWALAFENWVFEQLGRKDVGALCDFAEAAPQAALAHPSAEHFFPLFFTLGATLPGDEVAWVHREIQYASLSMSCFALGRGV